MNKNISIKTMIMASIISFSSAAALAEGSDACKKGKHFYSCSEVEGAVKEHFCSGKEGLAKEKIEKLCKKAKKAKKGTKKAKKKKK